MEEYQIASTSITASSSRVSAADGNDEAVAQSGRNRMKPENLGHKDGEPKCEM
jgi:hypothetical protein